MSVTIFQYIILILLIFNSSVVISLRTPKTSLIVNSNVVSNKFISLNYLSSSTSSFKLKIQTRLHVFNLSQDLSATAVCTGLSTALVYALTKLAKDGIIEPKLCRKLIHTLAAPAFVVFWPLYSSSSFESRCLASSLALFQLGRLVLAGLKKKEVDNVIQIEVGNLASTKTFNNSTSFVSSSSSSSSSSSVVGGSTRLSGTRQVENSADFNLADAISRTGSRTEALGGPVIYTAVLFFSILFFFRESPVGAVAIAQMAVGDGLADIFGRRFGKNKWSFAPTKSVEGTLAFMIGSFLSSCLLLQWLVYTNSLLIPINVFDIQTLVILLAISIICALVELVPVLDDNVTVPVVAAVLAKILLPN